jgi:hypothetical protein
MLAVSDHPPPLVDGIAVSASLLCLVHCLALPLLAASLPALGLFVTHSLLVHALLLGVALPLGLWALARGWRRAGWWPLALGLAGFTIAHWRNWRAGHRGAECQTSEASSIL